MDSNKMIVQQWFFFLTIIREGIFMSKLLRTSRPQIWQVLIWLSSALQCIGWAAYWSENLNHTDAGQNYQSLKGRLAITIVVEVIPSYNSQGACQAAATFFWIHILKAFDFVRPEHVNHSSTLNKLKQDFGRKLLTFFLPFLCKTWLGYAVALSWGK